jgi:hypothetical protein
MNLSERDAGKRFVAPSGREVEFIGKQGQQFLFVYVDDPCDGLALSDKNLFLLERPKKQKAKSEVTA